MRKKMQKMVIMLLLLGHDDDKMIIAMILVIKHFQTFENPLLQLFLVINIIIIRRFVCRSRMIADDVLYFNFMNLQEQQLSLKFSFSCTCGHKERTSTGASGKIHFKCTYFNLKKLYTVYIHMHSSSVLLVNLQCMAYNCKPGLIYGAFCKTT